MNELWQMNSVIYRSCVRSRVFTLNTAAFHLSPLSSFAFSTPLFSLTARSSLSIAAVVGGVVGGILFILFGLYRLVYGAPKKQFELPRKKRKRPVVTREARYRPDNLVGIDGSRFHTEKL